MRLHCLTKKEIRVVASIVRSQWYGAYDDGWGDLITEASYAHPAKFAKGLVYRIVKHGIERGYWKKGDTLLDPFGGVGLGGIAAAAHGMRWLGVELEARFVRMAAGYDCPGEAKSESEADLCATCQRAIRDDKEPSAVPHRYAGNFDLHRVEWERAGCPQPMILQGDSRYLAAVVNTAVVDGSVMSPPYGGLDPSATHAQGTSRKDPNSANYRPIAERDWQERETPRDYGDTPGQIGALTSPPYANRVDDHGTDKDGYDMVEKLGKYGDSDGQIGNQRETETYWDACHQVYAGLLDLMTPGGVAAIVVKSFVRAKKIVPLPEMTAQLLEDVGFEIVEWTDAMLIAQDAQADIFGGEYRKERKSFFRRLAERKGSPRIDSEVVIWARKPSDA